jgi:hypothetical protein
MEKLEKHFVCLGGEDAYYVNEMGDKINEIVEWCNNQDEITTNIASLLNGLSLKK